VLLLQLILMKADNINIKYKHYINNKCS